MTRPPTTNQALRDQALAWLLRLRDAPVDAGLQQAFAAWLAADPAHQQAYRQAQAHWDWMEPFKTQAFRARDQALLYRPPSRQPVWRSLAWFATAAVLLLGLGLALFSPQGWYGLRYTYATGKGQLLTVALEDGSCIELNTDSEVQVHFNHHRRQLELVRGEAFFTAAHNPARPFRVHAGHISIEDIGTAFDVYKQANQVSVAVQEGEVVIETQVDRRQLSAGQQLAYSDNGGFIDAGQTDIASATAWRQGLLVFRGRRLDEVMAEIGRYHDVQIHLPDPKLAELRVNGSFRTDQLDNMLNAVATLLPVTVKRITPREIVLEARH